jgi:hypothetical protein
MTSQVSAVNPPGSDITDVSTLTSGSSSVPPAGFLLLHLVSPGEESINLFSIPFQPNVTAAKVAVKDILKPLSDKFSALQLRVYRSADQSTPELQEGDELVPGAHYWVKVPAPLHLNTAPAPTAPSGLIDPTALLVANANVNRVQETDNSRVIVPPDGNPRWKKVGSRSSSTLSSLAQLWSSSIARRHHKEL